MPDMLPGSCRFPRVIGLQIDYRRPPEDLRDALEPHRVDGGVGGVDTMVYRSTRAANGRRRGPTARRRGRPRLQTCVDQPTEQLSRPDLRRRASAILSPSIVSTGLAVWPTGLYSPVPTAFPWLIFCYIMFEEERSPLWWLRPQRCLDQCLRRMKTPRIGWKKSRYP